MSTFGINISSHTEYYQNMYHKNLYAKILHVAVGGVKSPLVERILVYGFPSYNALKAGKKTLIEIQYQLSLKEILKIIVLL